MHVKSEPLVSIIINNYNYDHFLKEAIDSALNQTYPHMEVVVVDDGSTDRSRDIISRYDNRIIPVLKSNGGQSSSLNAGFSICKGEIICLLDSDDVFSHDKAEKIVELFTQNNLIDFPVILHNMFTPIDKGGLLIGSDKIENFISAQDFEWHLLSKIIGSKFSFFDGKIGKICTPEQVFRFAYKYRYIPYIGMPTSSISISRAMAEKVFPLPVDRNRFLSDHADTFLTKAASLMGLVYSTNLALTQYRFHGNGWHTKEVTQKKEELLSKLQDDFLNSKLEEVGKEPVFCFLNSMQASGFYRLHFGKESGEHLLSLSFSVIKWHLDSITLSFFLETFGRAMYYKTWIFIYSILLHYGRDKR